MKNRRMASGFIPAAVMFAALGMADVSLGAATPLLKAGENHTVMLRSNGTIWACGDNLLGQLGDGTTTARNAPVQVGTATDWVMVAGGMHHTVAIKANGALFAWGDNTFGQLGNNQATLVQLTPVQIGTDTDWKAVAAGDYHTLALKLNGTATDCSLGCRLFAWGDSADGTLGTGETYSGIIVPVPTQVGTDTDWVAVAAGPDHTMALKANGTLWGWGSNGSGQQGDRTNLEVRAPLQVGIESDWAAVTVRGDQTLARKRDGRLFAFGLNLDGQLGDGTFVSKDFPTLVNAELDWRDIATGHRHTVALKNDGRLFSWGNNLDGQLGDGLAGASRNTPRQVGNATHWVAIDAGEKHTLAMTDEGTIWSMGDNSFGQLCDGSNAAKAAPTPDISPLSGDIDQDGSVNIADALKTLRIVVGLAAPGPFDTISGDVGPLRADNLPAADGAISISDAVVILRKVVGLVTGF